MLGRYWQLCQDSLAKLGKTNIPAPDAPPLRSELLSADQMEQHGKVLAGLHSVAKGSAADSLLRRLTDNEAVLLAVCKELTAAVVAQRRVTPGGEWLLDNFYLIEEQIRTARRHLPRGYSRTLPRLVHGPSAGLPRVYDIALEMVAHGDGRVDTENLSRFVAAYQTVNDIKLGELWAIPIMLRLAVIENLRRVGARIAAGWSERDLACKWSDLMIDTAGKDPKSLILIIADMARSNPPLVGAFVAELTRRLQGRGPALALPLTWVEQRLSEEGLTIEHLVQAENRQQAADQVSVSNSIGSLRVLGAMDWREFVESMSIVERILRTDPDTTYGRMDFATRDSYRHAVERLAIRSELSEAEVADRAITLARAGSATQDRTRHVGYYLIGNGSSALEQVLSPHGNGWARLRRIPAPLVLPLYLGSIFFLTCGIAGALLAQLFLNASPFGQYLATSYWLLALVTIAMLSASKLAVAMTNWLATLLTKPKALPRMDFSAGIPLGCSCLVVVPTMLGSAEGIEKLMEALEVRFLANRDEHIYFGLVTDLLDADKETLPGDAALVQQASAGITALNEKYCLHEGQRSDLGTCGKFFLLHRARRWNPAEGVWMGYERKRGKLADLNALLRNEKSGNPADGFCLVVGNVEVLADIKYVVTLDTDTELPRDAARQFVGTMAHPLNHPRYDPVLKRVVEGYGILQPRVDISLPGANRSLYARLHAGESGIDPYTRAVSDVYQDVFGEGSFIGKGIYDVDAFEQSLADRFPANRILSHDLIEGCYARSGLLSDVQLYESYPASYGTDVQRRHRWMRGDWQLVAWLLGEVPESQISQIKNKLASEQRHPLTLLSQWKLIDNLRRSLMPVMLMALLISGWIASSASGLWTLTILGLIMVPALISALYILLRKPADVPAKEHLFATARAANRHVLQGLLEVACLPYEAYFSLDAIVRTIWRLKVSHEQLLEWNASSESGHPSADRSVSGILASVRTMWVSTALVLPLTIWLAINTPGHLAGTLPILALWLCSPLIVWWISLPLEVWRAPLSADKTRFLHRLSRRIWLFFDTYVGPEDHWLPPDNVQEYRVAAVAHRTSPTNIGLSLLANLTAYDFGYLCCGRLLERTSNTLATMQKLERHRGHLLNWYDTQSLLPLQPRYISSVDSGNLAGHLYVLRAGLIALPDDPIISPQVFPGLMDTCDVLSEIVGSSDKAVSSTLAELNRMLACAIADDSNGLGQQRAKLAQLLEIAIRIESRLALTGATQNNNALETRTQHPEAHEWGQALIAQCHEAIDELEFLAPWLSMKDAPAGLDTAGLSIAMPSLRDLADEHFSMASVSLSTSGTTALSDHEEWLSSLHNNISLGSSRARQRILDIDHLANLLDEFATLDYSFLFDKSRHLLSIGYNVDEHRLDASFYDLLASESRLSTFVGIARGQLPQESWFALGRLLVSTGTSPVLLSWSGSMFEYLMPLLVMPSYDNTLLDQTGKAAVSRQIDYGKQRGIPWGMSESGYNSVDVHLNYQYRAFGVPGLGLKRGLAEDMVVAPYASMLALMVNPEEACLNLQRLTAEGFDGRFGLFEAIDYTPARQRRGESHTVIRSFMAHHQGMGLLALSYLLHDRPMQRRFANDLSFQAVLLLLQERMPRATTLFTFKSRDFDVDTHNFSRETPIRVFTTPNTNAPQIQLLSNGRYHVLVSNSGGGYSRWNDLAITRWREDGTRDHWGSFCYIRELASGNYWSSAHQPTLKVAQFYEATFSEGRAKFYRRDALASGTGHFETHSEIVVSPEDDIELRRVRVTNRSRQVRTIDVTSYAEVVISSQAADELHPAFSKLFVQTEWLPGRHAIICTRRPRSIDEPVPWMVHLMVAHGAEIGTVSFETDRQRFVGRTRGLNAPQAMDDAELSGTTGSVLDPVVAIRYVLTIQPEQCATIDIVTGMAGTREAAIQLVDKYQDRHLADRVFDLAWTHSQVMLRQLDASEADSQLYAHLAGSIIYPNGSIRPHADVLIRNRRGQSGLWSYAISGDLPIVLVQIEHIANIELVRQLVQAHAYWRRKGLAVDLVIWNEHRNGYRQQLQELILSLIAQGIGPGPIDRPGGIYVRPAEQISAEDRVLFQTVARAVLRDDRGTLAEQLSHRSPVEKAVPKLMVTRIPPSDPVLRTTPPELILANGIGGFTPDGREYVISLSDGRTTPAPWVNVLANSRFGTIVSESGGAYTWAENAHEFRLSPWYNDPVSDVCGEAIYLRDEETGEVWSPTPLPIRSARSCVIRHGFGYSVFATSCSGISSELWVYVALDAPVKFSVLKLRNESNRPRQLSVTNYVEWVLGDLPAKSAMHVITELDPMNGALCARNPYSNDFSSHVAFLDVDKPTRNLCGDRNEFLGRNGTMSNPAAMRQAHLSGKVGAGLAPCGAVQIKLGLAVAQSDEVVFRLGAARNAEEARELVQRYRGAVATKSALTEVRNYWQHTVSAVQVETPDQSLNVLCNGWLVYQTLACRIWARSGFYQSGGAYGFRDQLQDVMALVHTTPGLVREHLLLCAGRQFLEGDVQHWWHPPQGRGVRTHCSDDYLWLPMAVCRYVRVTNDQGLLGEMVHYLSGRELNPADDSYYDQPGRSSESATVYQHCVNALQHALRFGAHGLPLMGSGDWNDGMNLVGMQGKGESVWLGFFLCEVLDQFIPVAQAQGDSAFAERCRDAIVRLRQHIEQHGWDGEWYRRAYFDDGTPLGSATNTECRIDSISQSWSVLSAGSNVERSRQAMNSFDSQLVHRDSALIPLLAPPFDTSAMDPGYIRGYVPGVRENGGQYTHAAIWAAMAFAVQGDSKRAWELLTMINPVNHSLTAAAIDIYKVEPYVISADVYALAPHVGRGGWSWYTGSAGWMYRLILESLLGLVRKGEQLTFAPCLPRDWTGASLSYRFGTSTYHIALVQLPAIPGSDAGKTDIVVDGVARGDAMISLIDDGLNHSVSVTFRTVTTAT